MNYHFLNLKCDIISFNYTVVWDAFVLICEGHVILYKYFKAFFHFLGVIYLIPYMNNMSLEIYIFELQ